MATRPRARACIFHKTLSLMLYLLHQTTILAFYIYRLTGKFGEYYRCMHGPCKQTWRFLIWRLGRGYYRNDVVVVGKIRQIATRQISRNDSPTVHLFSGLCMLSTVDHGPVLVNTGSRGYRRGWVDVPSLVGVVIHHTYAPRQWERLGVISAIKR